MRSTVNWLGEEPPAVKTKHGRTGSKCVRIASHQRKPAKVDAAHDMCCSFAFGALERIACFVGATWRHCSHSDEDIVSAKCAVALQLASKIDCPQR